MSTSCMCDYCIGQMLGTLLECNSLIWDIPYLVRQMHWVLPACILSEGGVHVLQQEHISREKVICYQLEFGK